MYHKWCIATQEVNPVLYIHYSEKVEDFWLSGEIYGKCKKFMLQWYYIMKVGYLSRSMQRGLPHLKQFIETKANNRGGYITIKMSMSHDTLIEQQPSAEIQYNCVPPVA